MNSGATRLWLIRHGEPEESVRGRCYGDLDAALSMKGSREMEALGQELARVRLDAIYTSPKRRALESARAIARFQECPVRPADALAEIHFGLFEGRSYDEIAAEYPGIYRQWMSDPTAVTFPEGESFQDLQRRVTACVKSLRAQHAGQTIALVTHGGVIRVLIAEALELEPRNIFRIGQDYAALNLITYLGDAPVVTLVNGRANLSRRKGGFAAFS